MAQTREERNAYQREWTHRPENQERVKKQWRDKRRHIRFQVLEALGGRCVRCGFSDARALQVDHVHDDGYVDRKERGVSFQRLMYNAILAGEQDQYQLLCANCNWIKRWEATEAGLIRG